jgi:hypothetical protein
MVHSNRLGPRQLAVLKRVHAREGEDRDVVRTDLDAHWQMVGKLRKLGMLCTDVQRKGISVLTQQAIDLVERQSGTEVVS